MSLNIDNSLTLSSCFHKPFQGDMLGKNQKKCSVKDAEFVEEHRAVNHKLFALPMRNVVLDKARENIPVKLSLYINNEPNCKKVKTFNINIIKTPDLYLGFTGISDKQCMEKQEESSENGQIFIG